MLTRRAWIKTAPIGALWTALSAAELPITVYLVRHAEKAAAPADNPVLSEPGVRRANTLAGELTRAGITAIYTSQFARTRLTAEPLAKLLRIVINDQIPAGKNAELVQAVLSGPDRAVLIVGHSNTVTQLIEAFGGGPVLPIADAWEYDNLYKVTVARPGSATTERRHYGERSVAK